VPLARPRRRDPAPLGCIPESAAADTESAVDAVADGDADADFEVFIAPARVQKASSRLLAPMRHLSPADVAAVVVHAARGVALAVVLPAPGAAAVGARTAAARSIYPPPRPHGKCRRESCLVANAFPSACLLP